MSETSGFFVSQGGDRKYTPDWLARYIKALVTTGVYTDELPVTAGSGMSVTVPPGRAWVEGYLYLLDNTRTLSIANADSSQGRKDIVVVRLDLTAREITIQVIQGTPAAEPVAPAITRTADVYDLQLAEISIPAGTSKITQDLILDTRLDNALCGLTVCTVQQIPTTSFLTQMTAEFYLWFEEVKGILGEDEAANLLYMIQALSYSIEFSAADWVAGSNEMTISIPALTHRMNGTAVRCRAFILKDGVYQEGVWATLETYATMADDGSIIIHYPGDSGYDGKAAITAY